MSIKRYIRYLKPEKRCLNRNGINGRNAAKVDGVKCPLCSGENTRYKDWIEMEPHMRHAHPIFSTSALRSLINRNIRNYKAKESVFLEYVICSLSKCVCDLVVNFTTRLIIDKLIIAGV